MCVKKRSEGCQEKESGVSKKKEACQKNRQACQKKSRIWRKRRLGVPGKGYQVCQLKDSAFVIKGVMCQTKLNLTEKGSGMSKKGVTCARKKVCDKKKEKKKKTPLECKREMTTVSQKKLDVSARGVQGVRKKIQVC